MDGNFKADHITSKPGTVDIGYGKSGEGYFVDKQKFSEHLAVAEDDQEVRRLGVTRTARRTTHKLTDSGVQ